MHTMLLWHMFNFVDRREKIFEAQEFEPAP
jgi:hypothetical protein